MTSKMLRARLSKLLSGAGIIVLLAGCVNLDVDFALNSKAEATGTYELTMAKTVASLLGVTKAEDLKRAVLDNSEFNLPAGNSVDVRDAGMSYVMTVTVKDLKLEDTDLKAEVLGDGNIRFTFKNEGTEPSSDGFDLGMDTGSIKLRITFPGPIVETGPQFTKESDQVATLDIALDEPSDTFVVSEPGSGGSSSPMVLIVVAGVVALLVIAGIVQAKRGNKKDAGSPGDLPPPVV
jgi:hypothetical protein